MRSGLSPCGENEAIWWGLPAFNSSPCSVGTWAVPRTPVPAGRPSSALWPPPTQDAGTCPYTITLLSVFAPHSFQVHLFPFITHRPLNSPQSCTRVGLTDTHKELAIQENGLSRVRGGTEEEGRDTGGLGGEEKEAGPSASQEFSGQVCTRTSWNRCQSPRFGFER